MCQWTPYGTSSQRWLVHCANLSRQTVAIRIHRKGNLDPRTLGAQRYARCDGAHPRVRPSGVPRKDQPRDVAGSPAERGPKPTTHAGDLGDSPRLRKLRSFWRNEVPLAPIFAGNPMLTVASRSARPGRDLHTQFLRERRRHGRRTPNTGCPFRDKSLIDPAAVSGLARATNVQSDTVHERGRND